MKEEIEGIVVDIKKGINPEKNNYSFLTRHMQNQDLYWKIGRSDLIFYNLPKYSNDEKVKIEWDTDKYTASLVLHGDKSLKLVRDFSQNSQNISQKAEKVEVLKCPSCGGNVALSDSFVAKCTYCSTKIPLSGKQLELIKMSVDIRKINEKLFDELNSFFSKRMKPGSFKVLSSVPLLLLSIQIIIIAWANFFPKANDFFSDEIVGEFLMEDYNFALLLVLPSMLFTIIWVFISRKNAFAIDIAYLYSLFSPTVKNQNNLNCRVCGNPLKNTKVPEFIACPYCQSENIMLANSASMKDISSILQIKYLTDVKILHNEFKNVYNEHFIGLTIGMIIFYGSYFSFTCFLDHIRHVHFIVHYFIMPFMVTMLIYLLSVFSALPFSQIEDWLPKYFKDSIDEKALESVETNVSIYPKF
ncbi:MAG: hypothetical protein P1P88_22935, partial [Bacteroidales bacterium]|nr:hypothetical protein [Bacteroidales bacterium]